MLSRRTFIQAGLPLGPLVLTAGCINDDETIINEIVIHDIDNTEMTVSVRLYREDEEILSTTEDMADESQVKIARIEDPGEYQIVVETDEETVDHEFQLPFPDEGGYSTTRLYLRDDSPPEIVQEVPD